MEHEAFWPSYNVIVKRQFEKDRVDELNEGNGQCVGYGDKVNLSAILPDSPPFV